ncbi:MAG: penicillin-binding protein 2 [Thalassobaculales bacterium]
MTSPIQLDGAAAQAIEQGRARLALGTVLFALAFATIGVRLVDVTLAKEAGEPRLAAAPKTAAGQVGRADIVDRNGMLLATSLKTASVYANPREIRDPTEAAQKLARVLPGLSEAEVETKLKSDRSFIWVKRNLTPRQLAEVNRLGLPGVHFQAEERRVYPHGPLAAHVVGFTDVDGKGLAGIEQRFDEVLRGGSRPVRLSIDLRLQHILREELQKSVEEFSAVGAAGMVMDVHTGEVLSMVSLPDFDANQPGTVAADTRFNRNTLGVYEMGSTFKIFNTAMALDAGVTNLRAGYDASRPIKVARFTINDDHAKNRWLSTPEIFMYSSNIGSVKMALDVGVEGQKAFMARLGMTSRPSFELPEVGAPLVPRPWREINAMTIAFGHGISVSPLQLVTGVAAVVNGGIMRPATLIYRDPQESLPPGRRVLSERTSEQMRKLLRLVVESGTGKNAGSRLYPVGGKTGTAEKVSGRGYAAKRLLSSFVSAYPVNDPRFVVLVMVDEPKGTKRTFGYATGGWVAAPVVRQVIDRMGPLYGLPPVDLADPEVRRALEINPAKPAAPPAVQTARLPAAPAASPPPAGRPTPAPEKRLASFRTD